MGRYIVRRTLWMVWCSFVVSVITFGLMHAVPGGPFDREKALPQQIIDNLNARYHLDKSLPVSSTCATSTNVLLPYVSHERPGRSLLDDAIFNLKLTEGTWLKWMNFGPSYISLSRTVNDIFRDNLPLSFQLGIMALLIADCHRLAAGYAGRAQAEHDHRLLRHERRHPGGQRAGHRARAYPGRRSSASRSSGSRPPGGGRDRRSSWGSSHRRSTWSTSATRHAGVRPGHRQRRRHRPVSRASLLQVIREDYIRTARAKGLVERLVVTARTP